MYKCICSISPQLILSSFLFIFLSSTLCPHQFQIMRSSFQSSHLLLLVLLFIIAHAQSDLQLATNSPEEFSLGSADLTPANEIIPPEDYANTEMLLSLSDSSNDEPKCSYSSNSPRHRIRVRGNDPSPLICPFNPLNQYNFKKQPGAPDGGQQQIDNSEAGQQFQLDGSNNNNRPQPENDQKKEAWWQRIIPDWLDLGRLLPGFLTPNKKTEELYYKGLCSNGNNGPSVTVCVPADPPLVARMQVVIEWCRVSTCDTLKPLVLPLLRKIFLVVQMTKNNFREVNMQLLK